MISASKKVSLITGIFFLACTAGWGQNPLKNSDDFVNKYKWDVSLDTYRLFRNGGATVFFKYSSNKKGAFRMAIEDGGANRSTFETTGLDTISIKGNIIRHTTNIGIVTGYEWRKSIGRHSLYCGGDISFIFRSSRTKYINYTIPQFLPSRDYVINLIPFIGLKYQLFDRLSLSSEANINLGYNVRNILTPDRRDIESSAKTLGVGFNPLRLINLSYHF